ncbi:unnamed protein product [Boreogadus saida]
MKRNNALQEECDWQDQVGLTGLASMFIQAILFISDDLPGQRKDFSDFTRGGREWTDRTRVEGWRGGPTPPGGREWTDRTRVEGWRGGPTPPGGREWTDRTRVDAWTTAQSAAELRPRSPLPCRPWQLANESFGPDDVEKVATVVQLCQPVAETTVCQMAWTTMGHRGDVAFPHIGSLTPTRWVWSRARLATNGMPRALVHRVLASSHQQSVQTTAAWFSPFPRSVSLDLDYRGRPSALPKRVPLGRVTSDVAFLMDASLTGPVGMGLSYSVGGKWPMTPAAYKECGGTLHCDQSTFTSNLAHVMPMVVGLSFVFLSADSPSTDLRHGSGPGTGTGSRGYWDGEQRLLGRGAEATGTGSRGYWDGEQRLLGRGAEATGTGSRGYWDGEQRLLGRGAEATGK